MTSVLFGSLESLIDPLWMITSKTMLAASSLIYLARYPFLPGGREYVGEKKLAISDLSSKPYLPVLRRAINRLELAIRYGFVDDRSEEAEMEILSFPLAVFLAACISDPSVSKRYAVGESERCFGLLLAEPNLVLERIAGDGFGLRLKTSRQVLGTYVYDFSLHVSDYLSLTSWFSTPSWKLANKDLYAGWVCLVKTEAAGLLRLQIGKKIQSTIAEAGDVSPPKSLERRLAAIRNMATEKREEKPAIGFSLRALPPCIRSMYARLIAGEGLPHFARFTLTSFFLNVGLTPQEILSLFSRLPDFDQHLSQYQIEHIAGRRGGVKRYTSPSCKTLRTHDLCAETEQCSNTRSPIRMYYRQIRRMERGMA